MSDPLEPTTAQLGDLEARMARLTPRTAEQEATLRLLAAVHRQQPGAYIKINDIAPWKTDRPGYRAVSVAVTQLVNAHEAETMRVAFGQTRHTMVRLVDDDKPNRPDGFGIGHQLSMLLADLNYCIEVTRSRDIGTNFTRVAVTHDGHQVDAWLHSWPFDVVVKRAEVR